MSPASARACHDAAPEHDHCASAARVAPHGVDGSTHYVQGGADPCRPGASLWARLTSFDALYAAYRRARRDKRYRSDVLRFSANLESELIQLHHELLLHGYRTSPYRAFQIDDPKPRQILAPAFRDRVVHHALCAELEPLFERRFIADSFACRVGKGSHAAARRLQAFLYQATRRRQPAWALKVDVAGYFLSIPHDRLRVAIQRVGLDPDVSWLIDEILQSTNLAPDGQPCGIPIGALTSQLFANVYLDQVDHLMKDQWAEPWYVRYMDDMVMVTRNRRQARARWRDLAGACGLLGLRLNHRSAIYPVDQGVPFVGYRIWPTHARVLQSSLRRMRRRLRGMRDDYQAGRCAPAQMFTRIESWVAHARHADSARVRAALLPEVAFTRGPSPQCAPRGVWPDQRPAWLMTTL